MSLSNTDKFTVYKLTFGNGKLYFGISSNIKKRLREHRNSEKCKPTKRPIIHAIQKHGWGDVSVDIVCADLSPTEAYKMESDLIREYSTQDFSKGYNAASGGRTNFGYKHPNIWSKGKSFTVSHREKLSIAKKLDPALRVRASDASSRFPVVATHIWTGERLTFKNANHAASELRLGQATVRKHILRNSEVLAGEWNVRRTH